MKYDNTQLHQSPYRTLLLACATALAVAFTASSPQPARANHITPPPVPANLEVPAGHKAFFASHAVGTQNYICLPCPNVITPEAMCPTSGFAWAFFGPQATLFDDDEKQLTTHFLSPNPFEINTPARPAWQHSKDTSAIWAMLIDSSTDPAFVAPGAIPWLLLRVVGAEEGPTGGDKLTAAIFIQRLNTAGGVAPSTGCTSSMDVGKKALVDYETDYFFYKAAKGK
jgi:hypothetical protein